MTGAEWVVGGWFASAVIRKLVDMGRSYLGDNLELHKGTRALLDDLERVLVRIEAVIEVAEQRPVKSRSLTAWLRQLKDAAYEAEDVLDAILPKVINRDKGKGKGKVSSLASSSLVAAKNLILGDTDLKKLKTIVDKLHLVSTGVGDLIEMLRLNSKTESIDCRETSSFLPDNDLLVGRDKETGLILDMILPSPDWQAESSQKAAKDPRLGVLPIVGIAGVGKTTLAKIIYNNQDVQKYFQLRMWVYVSENFDVKEIIREMRLCLGLEFPPNISLNFAQDQIMSILHNRRFLLVLDNLWNVEDSKWDNLRSVLTTGKPGSMVLVTTQSQRVANMMRTLPLILLDALPWDHSWKLFKHHAFANLEIAEGKEELLSIGEKIAVKLHGLPLAEKVIGRLLGSKLDKDEWHRILDCDWWNLDEGLDGILQTLAVSYQHLDAQLRQCFSYCSLFPRNYVFEKDRLIQMWIAHGFVQSSKSRTIRLEDLGSKLFTELVERSFLQPIWNNRYIMHDLMRELAVAVSSDECFVAHNDLRQVPRSVRHLSLQSNKDVIQDGYYHNKLRTVLFFGHYESDRMYATIDGILIKSISLRVLDLSYVNMGVGKPPLSICSLLHLRFLDLSFSDICIFPESFCGLHHLQVLGIRGCKFHAVPYGINKLINLQHLYADTSTISQIFGIGKLTNLQELNDFRVANIEGYRITELKNMREIGGRLCIQNIEKVASKKEAIEAKLGEKRHLNTLELIWSPSSISTSCIDEEILEGLQPHDNLRELKIEGYMGAAFPRWIMQDYNATNLQTIHLSRCSKLETLPSLGHLPNLKLLSLEYLSSIKHIDGRFYGNCNVGFPSLEVLKFSDMPLWEDWSDLGGKQFLPCLKKLEIRFCHSLRKAPLIYLISPVTKLELIGCGPWVNVMPNCLQGFTSLTQLVISKCTHTLFLSSYCLRLLENLCLSDCSELHLQSGLRSLIRLKRLQILRCPKLNEVPDLDQTQEEQGLSSLAHLIMDHSLLINNRSLLLGRLPSLRFLKIHECKDLDEFTMEGDRWLGQLSSLEELEFTYCYNLERLPSALATLSSMKKLTLAVCPGILSLTVLPPGLEELHINGCSELLMQRCQKDQGADWPMIAHICYIRVNYNTIQMLEN